MDYLVWTHAFLFYVDYVQHQTHQICVKDMLINLAKEKKLNNSFSSDSVHD